ncbi:MAG: hypothetical protein ACXAC7_07835 [Candidatus Hodarchaeales archaeon]|jgi:hypothetical protein
MIIFLGNHRPLMTPITILRSEFIHYIGCYYADGTKFGSGWSINASTPEQAQYYQLIYKKLVKNPSINYNLTYTKKPFDTRPNNALKVDLINYWNENAEIDLFPERIKIILSESEETKKWNEKGSLRIRDNRSLVLKLHLHLMNSILLDISTSDNKNHLWKFLFGILEGDGYVCGGKKRFGLGFACHVKDTMIREILTKLNIKFRVDLYKVKKGISFGIEVQLGLFEILLHLPIFEKFLFLYYSKRRKLFITRLFKQPTIQYLMSEKDNLSSFSFINKNNLNSEKTLHLLKKLFSETS